MNLDATFRPFVVTGFCLIILIALPFRIRSQATHEKLDRTQEGVAMMIGLRLAGLALWAGVIAFMIDPRVMAWSSITMPAAARWIGVGLTIVTAALLTWTLRSLGPNLTDTVVTRTAHALVTEGPYRWVRHPGCDRFFEPGYCRFRCDVELLRWHPWPDSSKESAPHLRASRHSHACADVAAANCVSLQHYRLTFSVRR